MLKIDGWRFATLIFCAHEIICNNTITYSSSSTLTTSNNSTTTESITTTTFTNSVSTTAPEGNTTVCNTAETTSNGSTMTEPTIISIGISAVVAVVVLVAACYYRRKKQSNSGTNTSMNNTGLYETHNEVFSQDNYDQINRVASERENTIMDRVYTNE